MSHKRKADDGAAASTTSAPAAAAAQPAAKRPAFASAAAAAASAGVKQEEPSNGIKQEADVAVKQEDDEEEAYTPQSHLAGLKRDADGNLICPYLDTINRRALDFDFEKLCSVSLAHANVYACLVCGKYFQGRGKNSHAYAHALDPELEHHVFINLATEEIYCLPDGYQIHDKSLEDIKYNLHPRFKLEDVAKLDNSSSFVHALDGTDYLPGVVGLNNIKHTDWLNVIVQALNFIPQFRNFFIVDRQGKQQTLGQAAPAAKARKALPSAASGAKAAAAASSGAAAGASSAAAAASPVTGSSLVARPTELATKYGELLAKIWNPRSFKGHVSPHELLQAITTLSGKRFQIGKFADALQVLSWFLHELHRELAPAGRRKVIPSSPTPSPHIGKDSIVHSTFQGEIKVTTTIVGDDSAAAAAAGGSSMDTEEGAAASAATTTTTVEYRPFLYLSLALPPTPLFQDATDRAIIPQVPLFDLLRKFDGQTTEVTIDPATKREVRRTYSITRLPKYLILHYQRFHENNWFWEKNPTLVNFPLQRLDLRPFTSGVESADLRSAESLRALSVSELKRSLKARSVACDSVVEKDELVKLMLSAPASASAAPTSTFYNLLSNIVHEGSAGSAARKELGGTYKCHTLHRASNTWYLTEDLHVHTSETMEQLVALSESYMQIYERQKE